ncbi:MAG: asparaginase [Proteobacteria bacterium]|nr:asparaginase [Pseudomonadota bacterium]
MQSESPRLLVLGTGGTIAGRAGTAADNLGYQSAQLGVDELLQGQPALEDLGIESEQLAQIDSKDMDHATWLRLLQAVDRHLARPELRGIVVTHGTDTLEETAWLLQRVLAPRKPVVLTAAMRPATSLQADGPQNLADALLVAATPGAAGVLAVLAGNVHGAADVRKLHTWRLDAFGSGDAGPLGQVQHGRLRQHRAWPQGEPLGLQRLPADVTRWPWVAIVSSHGGADARSVDALVDAGVQGLVVAGTGNGTVHQALAAALARAQARGVAVRVVSRCAGGPVVAAPQSPWPVYENLGPAQARVELMLERMAG